MNRKLIFGTRNLCALIAGLLFIASDIRPAAAASEEAMIVDLGTVTAGTEKEFDSYVDFEASIAGGTLYPSCGCIGVRMEQVSENRLRVFGAVRIGNETGQFSKHIDIDVDQEVSNGAGGLISQKAHVRLQLIFTARHAVELLTSQLLIASKGESTRELTLQSGTLDLQLLEKPPELVGPWVVSSRWDGSVLHVVFRPDAVLGDSADHHVRILVDHQGEKAELFLPVQVVRYAEFGVPLREWTLNVNERGDVDGTLWIKGIETSSQTRTVNVTVELKCDQTGYAKKINLEQCSVTAMGTLLKRIRIQEFFSLTLRDSAAFVAEIHVGEQFCSIPVVLVRSEGAR